MMNTLTCKDSLLGNKLSVTFEAMDSVKAKYKDFLAARGMLIAGLPINDIIGYVDLSTEDLEQIKDSVKDKIISEESY